MNWRILLFIPALAVGIFVFQLLQPSDDTAAQIDTTERAVPVQALLPVAEPVAVSFQGFGRVEPLRSWESVSQVDGRIVSVVRDLAEGTVIREGTVILQIDPRSYEIARDRAEANLQTAQAELEELDAQETTIQGQLELENRIEAVIQSDVDRRTELIERGTSAVSTLDQSERDLIGQQRRIYDLETDLDLIPVQRVSAEATLRTRQVELEEAERDLANTTITAPFTGRVLTKDVEIGEYIRTGDTLVTLIGLGAVEVTAEVQPRDVAATLELLMPDIAGTFIENNIPAPDMAQQILRSSGLEPVVRIQEANAASFPAEIVRIDGTIDEMTGTIGIVVRVVHGGVPDLENRRPPLPKGTFVTVEFGAETAKPWLTVPREGVQYEGDTSFVYVADAENRLDRRPVEILGRVRGNSILRTSFEEGDRVVPLPPEPAILGQSLNVFLTETGVN